jgi:hypothetical protein
MSIHICDKVYPVNMPYLIPKGFKYCPFCGNFIGNKEEGK